MSKPLRPALFAVCAGVLLMDTGYSATSFSPARAERSRAPASSAISFTAGVPLRWTIVWGADVDFGEDPEALFGEGLAGALQGLIPGKGNGHGAGVAQPADSSEGWLPAPAS